jgi:hypothetical protein
VDERGRSREARVEEEGEEEGEEEEREVVDLEGHRGSASSSSACALILQYWIRQGSFGPTGRAVPAGVQSGRS